MAMFDVFKKKKPEPDEKLPEIPPLPELPPLPETGGPEIPERFPQPPRREPGFPQRGGMGLPPKPEDMEFPELDDTEEFPPIRGFPPVERSPFQPERSEPEPRMQRPEIPKPEPLQLPRPRPMPVEAREMPEVVGLPGPPPLPKKPVKKEPISMPEITPPKRPEIGSVKPHLFVKIDKYNEVVDSVQKLKSELTDIRKTLKSLESLDSESMEKLKTCDTITNKIAELISFFEQSFTAPEE